MTAFRWRERVCLCFVCAGQINKQCSRSSIVLQMLQCPSVCLFIFKRYLLVRVTEVRYDELEPRLH